MKSKLPQVHKRNGRYAYLDPIRKKLIYITPEETVRQHVISYLLKNLKIPKNLICVEEPLKHYGIKTKDRADIIIDRYDEESESFYPLAVIECKAPDIYLDDCAHKQMFGYAEKLGCDYCVLTNGEENFCFYNNEKIDKLPSYSEMLGGKYNPAPTEKKQQRLKFNEIEVGYEKYLERYEQAELGYLISEELAIPMTNFLECLLDTEHKMPTKKYKIFRLIEDYGIRFLTVGDSSSWKYFSPYRSFLVEYNGNTNFVSISILDYGDGSKTSIGLAIDTDKGTTHHSALIDIDNYCEIFGNKINFYHHGRTTKGRQPLKVDGLRKLVSEKYPEIIYGKKFYLGTLTNNRLWYLDDPEVMKVVENLISYALIRDDYRAMF